MVNFDKKMQEKFRFFADYLVVSKKSSTFACFFAARERAYVCAKRWQATEGSKTKRLN